MNNETKIFGVGLSKTGTSSLGEALNILGIKTIHYPFDDTTYKQLTKGDYNLHLLKQYQGIVDIPVAPYYAQLDEAFPGSRFILTVRDLESWLRSVDKHWELMMKWWHNYPDFKRFQEFISVAVYGSIAYKKERFEFVYKTHAKNVLDYFNGRSADFLVMDICGGDGWEPLCTFLNVPVPEVPFPHANEWMHKLMEATHEIKNVINEGETFILIDQEGFGDGFSAGRTAIPFMEKDGNYYGLPASDKEAMDEFERLQEKQPGFLVMGWPAFWWKEYYKSFYNFLLGSFDCITDNERLVVFKLR